MNRHIFAGFVSVLAVMSGGVVSNAQPPSKDDARRILGPRGGTILVYEIDRKVPDLPAPRAVDVLVNDLTSRITPNSLYDVTIRKSEKDRLEIILAVKGKEPVAKEQLADGLKRIKLQLAKLGLLEFSVVANSVDDKAAVEDARKLINSGGPEIKKASEEAQVAGLPPPAPRNGGLAGEPKVYDIVMNQNAKSRVSYRWVELSERQMRGLNLDHAAKDDPKRNETWKAAAKVRGQATTLPVADQPDWHFFQGALFYSRECSNRNLPDDERRTKPIDYFVLVRNPEIVDGKQASTIDGSCLKEASKTVVDDRPTLTFQLNAKGADLLGNLTRKNVSTVEVRRHLAIILDGAVMSSPTINSEIRTDGQISGGFTVQQVDEMLAILRAGRSVVTLRPHPVSEITIEPATK